MEIQSNTNIVTNLTAGSISAGTSGKQDKTGRTGQAAELSSDFAKLQMQVLQLADDPAKVESARKALLNGELDSETAILSAADNLLTFGL